MSEHENPNPEAEANEKSEERRRLKAGTIAMARSALMYSGHFDRPELTDSIHTAVDVLGRLGDDLMSTQVEFDAQVALGNVQKKLLEIGEPKEAAVVESMMKLIFFSDSTW